MSFPTVPVREVVEPKTGTKNPTVTSGEIFTYVDVAAVDNQAKAITGQRNLLGSEAPSRARKLIRQGDVLVSTVRPNLNAVALVPASLDGAVASTGFCVLRANFRVSPEYLLYFVRSQVFVESLCTLVAGAMYPAVSDSQVLDQQLRLPPLPEQRRIVDLLSRAEGIVRLRREAEKKAAELIPALFLDMFGDPATNPKGWKSGTFGNAVADIRNGFNPTKDQFGSGTPFITVNDLYNGLTINVSEAGGVVADPASIAKYRLQRGDLCFVRSSVKRAGVGMVSVFNSDDEAVFGGFVIRAKLINDVMPIFGCAMFHVPSIRKIVVENAGTGTITNINQPGLLRVPIVLPPLKLQQDFVAKVNQIVSIHSQQSTATAKAQATFDALLADAFKAA